jgi:hypothetical protein
MGITFRCVERDGRSCLLVSGAPPGARLSVVPSELAGHANRWQPVAGRFSEDKGGVRFIPRFPLMPELRYSLLLDGLEVACTEVPAVEGKPTTEVVSIAPTAEMVPFNLLRVYVCFSAPMSEGWAGRAVQVRHADTGEPLEAVFLPMEPELWDSSRRRLTLLLDPGRIKRGLLPNAEAGYPLAEGVPVSVVVGQSFRDAQRQPLRAPADRRYQVGPAIRARVDPSAWRLRLPRAGSESPLVAAFERPLDRALLRRCLAVVDSGMTRVPGETNAGEGDSRWRFTPSSPWRAGDYALRVDALLEDVAGNSVRRVFDRDLHLPGDEPLEADFVDRPFRVR